MPCGVVSISAIAGSALNEGVVSPSSLSLLTGLRVIGDMRDSLSGEVFGGEFRLDQELRKGNDSESEP